MRVCIIGTGYIGLLTSAILAELEHQVICINENEAELEHIQSIQSKVLKQELKGILSRERGAEKLKFSINLNVGVANSQIIFIAVDSFLLNTPKDDLSQIEAIVRRIGMNISGEYKVIVNKSIPYFGIRNWIREIIDEEISKRKLEVIPEFDVVDSPELLPISFTVGSNSQRAIATLEELYMLKQQVLFHNRN